MRALVLRLLVKTPGTLGAGIHPHGRTEARRSGDFQARVIESLTAS